jgi:hypothetical protein
MIFFGAGTESWLLELPMVLLLWWCCGGELFEE